MLSANDIEEKADNAWRHVAQDPIIWEVMMVLIMVIMMDYDDDDIDGDNDDVDHGDYDG